jgi:hypothetical protein
MRKASRLTKQHMSIQGTEIIEHRDMDDAANATGKLQDAIEGIEKSPELIAQQVLIEKVLQGDTEAFGDLVDQYRQSM